jgi:3-hydroxyisobutyrate dehydrogenase-like beta-hydroxyacid dehydrogenase
MKLGFIGLGAMGAPMARNLLEAGHEVAVWNRSPEKVVPLVEVGARRADSPANAASGVAQRRSGNLISGSYQPQFKLSHELKDLYYALELGRDLEDPLPICAVVSQIYNAGMKEHAEDDMSAVAEVYRQRVNARPAQV